LPLRGTPPAPAPAPDAVCRGHRSSQSDTSSSSSGSGSQHGARWQHAHSTLPVLPATSPARAPIVGPSTTTDYVSRPSPGHTHLPGGRDTAGALGRPQHDTPAAAGEPDQGLPSYAATPPAAAAPEPSSGLHHHRPECPPPEVPRTGLQAPQGVASSMLHRMHCTVLWWPEAHPQSPGDKGDS
jgi:hypothetical protein